MPGTGLVGVGLVTGWGEGLGALPEDAAAACGGRATLAVEPAVDGERFRRATRECRLGVAAVRALLATLGRPAGEVAGESTALVYVTVG